eukprot:281600_1
MTTLQSNLKLIPQRQKDIVSGYIREYHCDVIPDVVMDLIIIFFYTILEFDSKHHGTNLQFINGNIVKKLNKYGCRTCIFGGEINDSLCREFNIYCKWKTVCNINGIRMYFGFILSTLQSIDFNDSLGGFQNRKHCISFYVHSRFNQFLLSQKDNDYNETLRNYKSPTEFKQGDIFKLNVNFPQNELTIYHNGRIAEKTTLHYYKKIIPALSLYDNDNEVEIIKYEFVRQH